MSRAIKGGDIVDVYFNDDSVYLGATVITMPTDCGDFLYIRTTDGQTLAINPNSARLNMIRLVMTKRND